MNYCPFCSYIREECYNNYCPTKRIRPHPACPHHECERCHNPCECRECTHDCGGRRKPEYVCECHPACNHGKPEYICKCQPVCEHGKPEFICRCQPDDNCCQKPKCNHNRKCGCGCCGSCPCCKSALLALTLFLMMR